MKQLESLKGISEKRPQRVLLCSWIVEISTASLKRLELAADGELPESATLLQKQQKEEAKELYYKNQEAFRQFLEDYESDLEAVTVFELLQNHCRLDDFLHFASHKVCFILSNVS